jgi:hypothetical protein
MRGVPLGLEEIGSLLRGLPAYETTNAHITAANFRHARISCVALLPVSQIPSATEKEDSQMEVCCVSSSTIGS